MLILGMIPFFLIFTFSSKIKGWDNVWPVLVVVPTRKICYCLLLQ